MNKENAERNLRYLQRVKTWQLVLLLVVMLFVAAIFLRLNNIGMIQRRDAVASADQQGDADILQARLYDLQRYTATHMNANTGVLYLKESYDRNWLATQEAARAQNQAGGENIYNKIEQEVCAPLARANGWRWPDPRYIACQREELAKYPEGQSFVNQLTPPNKELYRYTFVSPPWSPDFAGFSLLVCAVMAGVIMLRLIGVLILQFLLKKHYRNL